MMKNLAQNLPRKNNIVSSDELEKHLNALLDHAQRLHSKEIDLGLARVERFLHALDDPHLRLPPAVHVAGTNGKGSTLAVLRSIIEAHHQTSHVMTSPHLIHPCERIRLAGTLIETEDLIDLLEQCIAVNEDKPITFFEIFTAATFMAFAQCHADYALLETGLGGRFDATNIVPKPACTIITTISRDHEDFLGSDLDQIAFEKAGIMKANVPCIIGWQSQEAINHGVMEVFHNQYRELSPGSALYRFGSEWGIEPKNGQMHFWFMDESYMLPKPSLKGIHQIYNSGAALAAWRVIQKKPLDIKNISTALAQIQWCGRLQNLTTGHFLELLPDGWDLWVDGGHNDSAGEMLADQIKEWCNQDAKPVHMILGMVDRKNPSAFLKSLIRNVKTMTCIEITDEKTSFSAKELVQKVLSLTDLNLRQASGISDAIRQITTSEPDPGRILITGSLYLVGQTLKENGHTLS